VFRTIGSKQVNNPSFQRHERDSKEHVAAMDAEASRHVMRRRQMVTKEQNREAIKSLFQCGYALW
jgi:hypothetical protein